MAKKKKGKVIQMLSPEKYIRQRARSLPIYECWVNESWNDEKLANIVVARQHTNNNCTVGMYLVDLNCLGIKDTQFLFNIPLRGYRELLEELSSRTEIEPIAYTQAHNIVFAGFEYAEDLGFTPHPDFALTQYILEEDNEEIDLIDIECGHQGKPFYLRGPMDSDARAAQIIAQLDRVVGPGNYHVADTAWGEDDEFDDADFLLDYDEAEIENSVTFQFKIQLKQITKPPVWRKVAVPSYFSFSDFHAVIQFSFGWENDHLFQFSPKGYGSNPVIKESFEDDFDPFDRSLNADETPLSEIFYTEKQKFTYIYDFGDDWTHTITLEKIIPEASRVPVLLDGKGKCPPEDCGGVWGYSNMKEILADKTDPEHKSFKEWLGLEKNEQWDPTEFNMEEHAKLLSEVFPERKKDN
jgi:hypothetical protein